MDKKLIGPRKSTKLVVLSRVEQVFNKIMNGSNTSDILQYCSEHWNISRRMAHKYMARARQRIEIINDANIDNSYSFHIAKRLQLLTRCVQIKDKSLRIKMELDICKDMADIQGLYRDRIELIEPERKEAELKESMELAGVEFEVITGKSEYGT